MQFFKSRNMKPLALLFIMALIFCHCTTKPPKPNILWITIEDTSPQFIGCYGNHDARTPEIDKLAKEGVRFTNAFSTGTVCSPSRSAIITGARTYEMGTGNHRSNYRIPASIHGFPYYLKQLGYYVTNHAKTDYNVFDMKAFTDDAWNESSNKAGWWNRKPGQPFFSVFNFNSSHQSRTMTNPYAWYKKNVFEKLPPEDTIGEDEFDMPPIYRDSPIMRKYFARVYNSISLTDLEIGELLRKLEKDGLKDNTIIFFYADHGEGMPRGKTDGINYGYRVPMVVWFPEKYKYLSPWGTGGKVSDELIDFEDLAPTLISLAGGSLPAHLKGRVLMGDKRSEPTDQLVLSADRSDNGIDMVRSVTDGRFMYSRNYMPFIPQQRYIRYMEISDIVNQMRADYKTHALDSLQQSVFEARPAEYLFDIENDLWETKNLVNDPQYQAILKKMRHRLHQEILGRKDVMFLPEYEIAKISDAGLTPYEFRLDKQKYDLDKILEVANLSGYRGADITQKQVAYLKSNNDIIRYWAMTGLRSQTKEDVAPYRKQIEEAMNDRYPPVAIVASAMAYELFGNKDAMEQLKTFCQSDNQMEALLAINYIMYMKDKTPFIDTIRATYKLPNREYNIKAACMDFLGSLGLVPNTFKYKD